jgi:glutamate-5-semialdehyde dehydrogenase
VKVIQRALEECGLPAATVQAIENPDRALVGEMLKMDKYIDMLIPRGGAGLHKLCREQSTIPVITGGIGVCHIYIDDSADIAEALKIIVNAKVQRPSACNSVETCWSSAYRRPFPASAEQTDGGKRRDAAC